MIPSESAITLTLPYSVSVNELYVPVGRGQMYLSAKGADYKQHAGWIARIAYRDEPMTCDVAMRLSFYRPRRRGDLSNLVKVIEDAFTGILYDDDDRIVEEHLFRFEDPSNPRVEVTLWKVEDARITF